MNLRVAAYCRVSTDRGDQANSLQSQQLYFSNYIKSHEDWQLSGIYADEGISGTSTRKREQFNRMIRDAQAGDIDLILTKEVSRFARNTVDALNYTRSLTQMGIGVIFINDNIDTRDNDGELRLTIMASIAQEESRKTSERVKWGQKRRMEAGVVFGNNTTYGFTTEDGKLSVKEEEAKVVRHIYSKFLYEGKGTHVIARELYEEGISPPRTATGQWSSVMVRRLLRNEKYTGDLLQKKFVTVNYLTHQKVENHGREEQVYLKDHHEAVIERSMWEATQAELARRNAKRGETAKYSNRYWCSGKIRCSACGSRFVLRKNSRPNGDTYKLWGCHSRTKYGNWKRNGQGDYVGCNMRMVNDKSLKACVQFVLKKLDLDYDAIVAELAEDIRSVQAKQGETADLKRLEGKLEKVRQKIVLVMDNYFSGIIDKDEMLLIKERYNRDKDELEAKIQAGLEAERIQREQQLGAEEIVETIQAGLTSSEEVFAEVVDGIVVFDDYIEIKVQHLPMTFRLWYSTRGAREYYTTAIDKWEIV